MHLRRDPKNKGLPPSLSCPQACPTSGLQQRAKLCSDREHSRQSFDRSFVGVSLVGLLSKDREGSGFR
jgi:hypothetical protein